MARKLCLQLLSHFLQSSLYFFPPRSSRKNAHSLLRYFGIRGIAGTSFSLPNCRFAPETQKRPKPFPAVWFRGDFGRFFRYERLCFSGGILYRCLLYTSDPICQSLKKGKEVIDRTVEKCLLKRALGYTYEEVRDKYEGDVLKERTVTTCLLYTSRCV